MPEPDATRGPAAGRQVLGSLLAGLAIVAITILVVTLKFGPTPIAELEQRQDAQKERIDAREDARDARMDQREERRER